MVGTAITLEAVDEALEANRRLQAELQQKWRQLRGAQSRIADLLLALCKSLHTSKVRGRVVMKRDRVNAATATAYFDTYLRSTKECSPFRVAGFYAERGCLRYASLPLAPDEVRWNEAKEAFPPPFAPLLLTTKQDLSPEKMAERAWSKEEDEALIAAVRGYAGNPCGANFWKALAVSGCSRFEIASRYVALKGIRRINFVAPHRAAFQLSDEERTAAVKEAVRCHVGDGAETFAAFSEFLAAAARRRACMAEVAGEAVNPFPPYVWELRHNFNRLAEPFVQEASRSVAHLAVRGGSGATLSQRDEEQNDTTPSLVDCAACLLAFKAKLFGKSSLLWEIVRIFLPGCGNDLPSGWHKMQLSVLEESLQKQQQTK
ncbi:small nuclear RNA activating protein 2 [Trypanosoma conorhini]|uniref:Small nuclear RNA activating protein 2 n=1 Tax=Trypanosoma conorhini TaxID=83891 RepID=A0A422PH65_9TRYP|nr:small nuclear RNA activating protein 2 [Trypanosoma conorhini]RNF17033.1 small nuclear RNA activating protein 2 [Trypanosoma conorhini]